MAEDAQYSHDPKFRQFSSSIDKALRSFESTSEWADLISALGKVSKALQSHVQFPVVPKKYTIGKRLSQCTHPALPSGCHLKALEVYNLIFVRIGHRALARDIFIYAAGLFPLLGASAMSVRPYLLSVYEKHFLPLGHHLSPALQGLVLALLPGLEEGSEHTERVQAVLLSVCECTDKWLFYNALWGCVLNVSSCRLPALTLLLSQVAKDISPEDQQYLFGDDLVTMVKGLSAALVDGVVLVQRSALDILVALLPLHEEFFLRSDTVFLLKSALFTLLRRDMSLSRRLFVWLLGHHGKSTESQARKHDYFIRYSKPLVVSAMQWVLQGAAEEDRRKLTRKFSSELQAAKLGVVQPIRILTALLDKDDVGYLIVDDLILEVVRALHKVCTPSSDVAAQSNLPSSNSNVHSAAEKAQLRHERSSSAGSTRALDELRLQMQSFFELLNPVLVWQHFAACFHQIEQSKDGCLRMPSGMPASVSASVSEDNATDSHAASRPSSDVNLAGSRTICSMVELVDLASFLLSFMPLESILEMKDGTLHMVFCHCMRAMRQHCRLFPMATLHRSILLCSKLLARTPAATSPILATSQVWPDTPTLMAPRLSPEYLGGTMADSEERAEAAPAPGQPCGPDVQLVEVCLHYTQSFLVALVTHCLRSLRDVSQDSDYSLPAFESIVQQSLSADGRLFSPCANADLATLDALDVGGVSCDTMDVTFAACARLLIDLSTSQIFPMQSLLNGALPAAKNESKLPLPDWLNALVACTCACPSFRLASSAVLCLLQLCEAAHNGHLHCQALQSRRPTAAASTTNAETTDTADGYADGPSATLCNVQILLLAKDREILELKQSTFFQGLAALLWRELDHCGVQHQAVVAQMLCQLNGSSLAPGVLERVICADFSSSDMNISLSAHKRFALLWHLSFEDDFASNSPHLERTKLFLRPLNLMLDGLASRQSWCRALSHAWLEQVLCARDLHRLLQPLLLALLTPNSVRVRRKLVCPSVAEGSGKAAAMTYTCCVYVRSHDTAVSVYALKSLLNIVRAQPLLLVTQAAGCQLPRASLCQGVAALDELLARHEISISGGSFDNPPGKAATSRGSYFEVMLTVLSWTMESTFTDEEHQSSEMQEQLELLQVTSVELLVALLSACTTVLQHEKTSSNASYIRTLLQMCIFHRSFLTGLTKSMVPTVLRPLPRQQQPMPLASAAGTPVSAGEQHSTCVAISASQKAFQLLLLELAEVVIHLEGLCEELVAKDTRESEEMSERDAASHSLLDCGTALQLLSQVDASTLPLCRLALQPAFQGAVAFALSCPYLTSVHCNWLAMISRSVEHLGPALFALVTTAVSRVSQWLLRVASMSSGGCGGGVHPLLTDAPPLYLPNVLRNWASLLHYAMLGVQPMELLSNPLSPSTSKTSVTAVAASPTSPPPPSTWAFVLPFGSSSQPLPAKSGFHLAPHIQAVSEAMLSGVVSVVQPLVDVWCAWRQRQPAGHSAALPRLPGIWGSSEHVSRQIVATAYPIGLQYPVELLTAFAQVWLCEQKGQSVLQLHLPSMVSSCTGKQEQILSMMSDLQCMSCEVLLTIGKRLIGSKQLTAPLEEGFFHLLIHSLKRTSSGELQRCWPCLHLLLKHSIGINTSSAYPPRLFLSTVLLVVYLEQTPQVEDRKLKREIQDISQRYLDACINVVAASLENTAWLRRSMAITASHLSSQQQQQSLTDPAAVPLLPSSDAQDFRGGDSSSSGSSGVSPSRADSATPVGGGPATGTAAGDVTTTATATTTGTAATTAGAPAAGAAGAAGVSDAGTRGQPADDVLLRGAPVDDVSARADTDGASSSSLAAQSMQRGAAESQGQGPRALKASVKLIAVYSPQALQCLSHVMATFVDTVYGSEDKERAVAILTNMMVYVLPFLKTRSAQNLPSSTAAIRLLSAVSEFHYTRKAWRREITDLFFDAGFFHFDSSQLSSWCSIIDNLLGHDKQARQELLGRVSISQGGLNLFTNSDMEMQQRAHLLKRLSFAVFSSPKDQYEALLPDIQERLAEGLRLQMAPTVHRQVFFCWRVLLIRMSASSLTAFWPVMMTELIQVLLQLEQDLVVDATKMIRRRHSAPTHQQNDPWLGLYLSACKLLDLVLALPASLLPQFQMYQWAFVGAQRRRRRIVADNNLSVVGPPEFEPYMVRMVDLLDQPGLPEYEAIQQESGKPLLSVKSISSLLDLKPFVLGLVKRHYRAHGGNGGVSSSTSCSHPQPSSSAATVSTAEHIAMSIGQDFLEDV